MDASIRIATLRTKVEELDSERIKYMHKFRDVKIINGSYRDIVEKAREEISNIKCVCDEAWTARDRHSGDCARGMIEFHLEDTIDALAKLKEVEE